MEAVLYCYGYIPSGKSFLTEGQYVTALSENFEKRKARRKQRSDFSFQARQWRSEI